MKEKDYEARMLDGISQFSRNGKPRRSEWKEFSKHLFYFEGDFTAEDTFRRLEEN
jgi:glucose-6-phosphate 1-dehydrogenase